MANEVAPSVPASNTGFGWLDSLVNTATGLASAYWQYDTAQNYVDWQMSQNAATGATPTVYTTGTPLNGQNLLMWGLIGLAGVLVYKAVK